jgi:hypothetical protein
VNVPSSAMLRSAVARRKVIHMYRARLGCDGHRPGEPPGSAAFLQVEPGEPHAHRVPPRVPGGGETELHVAVAQRGIALEETTES